MKCECGVELFECDKSEWHNKGRFTSKNRYGKLNIGSNNGLWKGDKVKYSSLHDYIKHYKPKPEFCEECKKRKAFDLCNISGKYKRDINDYEWLCRRCHMIKDGRMHKLIKRMKNQPKEYIEKRLKTMRAKKLKVK